MPNAPAHFVTRAEWGASSRGATTSSHPIGQTQGVTLHWEGPHMGNFSHASCASKVRGIQAFHKNDRGWADIAYNAVVCPHGYVFEGRGVGVTSAANGNETTNGDWYAVCYLGGQGDGFTDEGKGAFVEAVQWLRRNGAGSKVNGHRDHKSTECPGQEIYDWLQRTNFDEKVAPPVKKPNRVQQAHEDLNHAARLAMRCAQTLADVAEGLAETPEDRVVIHRRRERADELKGIADQLKSQIRDFERNLPDA